MSHNSTAAKVRREKEDHPERFCPDRRCLWRIIGKTATPCAKHPCPFPRIPSLESGGPPK